MLVYAQIQTHPRQTHTPESTKTREYQLGPHVCNKHKLAPITPVTYIVRLARRGRVCVQQRCHHLLPGLLRCGTMQR